MDLEVAPFKAVGAIEVGRGPAQFVAWHLAPGAHGREVGPGLTRIATGLGIGCSELARDMAGDSREAAQASDQARFGHGLVHAHQHRLEVGAGRREPPGLVRASEIAQVAIRDAPPDRPAFRRTEAFLLQTSFEFAVVPGFEAFLSGQGLQAPEDAVLSGASLHQRGPVADERITRRIEVALQTRRARASLPVDIGAEMVADLAGGAHGGIIPDAEAFRVERPAECARTGWVGRA